MVALLLTGILTSAFNIQQAKSSGPPPTEWTKAYGGLDIDYAYSVVQTADGGYALAGYTESFGVGADFWLIKTDSAGNALWNKTYGGNDTDIAYSTVQASDLGYALAGYTYSNNISQNDIFLVKADSSGTMQWNRTYGGTNQDYAYSVVQTRDGGYALAGATLSFGAGGADFYLVKTDSAGILQWNRTYGGGNNDYAESVIQTSDGGYALAGYTDSFGAGGYDFWLVKTDPAGNMQWNKTYGGKGSDQAYSAVQTSDGGYALAGYTNSFGAGGYDFWLVKTDAVGTTLWNKTYGGTNQDSARSLVLTSDGGYAIAGYTYSGVGFYDFCLVKADSSGNLMWSKTIGGKSSDLAYSVVQTRDGGYALAGYTTSYGCGNDFWLVKVAAEVHDLAVTNVRPSKTVVGQGYSLLVNVTVQNQGNVAETFIVTLYANNSAVQAQTITLASGGSTTIHYAWNTTNVAYGNYNLKATAQTVPGETDIADNTYTYGMVLVTISGDVNGDRVVNCFDLFVMGKAYGCKPNSLNWNPNVDINCDGTVNVLDLAIISTTYEKIWP